MFVLNYNPSYHISNVIIVSKFSECYEFNYVNNDSLLFSQFQLLW